MLKGTGSASYQSSRCSFTSPTDPISPSRAQPHVPLGPAGPPWTHSPYRDNHSPLGPYRDHHSPLGACREHRGLPPPSQEPCQAEAEGKLGARPGTIEERRQPPAAGLGRCTAAMATGSVMEKPGFSLGGRIWAWPPPVRPARAVLGAEGTAGGAPGCHAPGRCYTQVGNKAHLDESRNV